MKRNRFANKVPFVLLGIVAVIGLVMPNSYIYKPVSSVYDSGDVAWILSASGLVLLMTPGLAFFYAGLVRYRNLVSTLTQSFISLGVVTVLWILVGFSLSFGESMGGFCGNPATFFMFKDVGLDINPMYAQTIPFALWGMFQMKFAIITPALITGALAERVRFISLLLFISLFCIFIYAPLAHWTWHPNGFLHKWGVLDFAGGTVVHISAGFAALAGAIYLGRRKSFHDNVPANIPYVILGTGLLWFGWLGFNGGSSLAADSVAVEAFVNTNITSATSMLTWLFLDSLLGKKRSSVGACLGALVGLAAITPGAGHVSVGNSIFIGFVAAIVSHTAIGYARKINIDDTLDVFPTHGLGGIVGMMLTAIFAEKVGLIYGETDTFFYHFIALGIVTVFTFGGSLILYKVTDMIIPLRVTEHEEQVGLDISQHGEKAFNIVAESIADPVQVKQKLTKTRKIK